MSDNPTVYDITSMPPGTEQLMLATETQPMGLRLPTYPVDPDPYRVKGPCREEPDFNVLVADIIAKDPDRFASIATAYPFTEADTIFYTGVAAMRTSKETGEPVVVKGGILEVLAPNDGKYATVTRTAEPVDFTGRGA